MQSSKKSLKKILIPSDYRLVEKHDSIFGPKIFLMFAKNNEIHLDIDNIFDFFLAEMTMKFWKKYSKL
jgi:hypothetical protein